MARPESSLKLDRWKLSVLSSWQLQVMKMGDNLFKKLYHWHLPHWHTSVTRDWKAVRNVVFFGPNCFVLSLILWAQGKFLLIQ